MGKIKTPDRVLKGKEKPEEKKKSEKIFKTKVCPKCGNDEVNVILSGAEGRGSQGWECKKCKWQGKQINEKEITEDEFLKMEILR